MNRLTSAIVACLLGLAASSNALAHDPEAEARWRLEQALAKPWVAANGFNTDFDKALETAAKDQKPIFAFFTLSYMPVPECEKLENDVISTPEFKKFSEGVVPFLHVNGGLGGRHSDLLREKGGLGVPYFAVMDEQGNVIARVERNDVVGFDAAVKSGIEFAKLKAKADKTAEEKLFVLTHEMDIGNLKLQLAKDRVAALGKLTEAEQKQIDASMFRLEVWTAVSGANDSYEKRHTAGKLFAEMWAAGKAPAAEELWRPFFVLMLDHAERAKDAKLFAKALDTLKARFGARDEPGWKDFFQEQAERLKEIAKPEDAADEKKDGGGAR